MKSRLDANEWQAKYQQNPFIREGILFPEDGLRYYNGILPEGDSRVVTVCDVAWGGGDSLSMPIGREYENGDIYILTGYLTKERKKLPFHLLLEKSLETRYDRLTSRQTTVVICTRCTWMKNSKNRSINAAVHPAVRQGIWKKCLRSSHIQMI